MSQSEELRRILFGITQSHWDSQLKHRSEVALAGILSECRDMQAGVLAFCPLGPLPTQAEVEEAVESVLSRA